MQSRADSNATSAKIRQLLAFYSIVAIDLMHRTRGMCHGAQYI
jgi:hypothetical protein